MAQFDIVTNKNDRNSVPYLLELQSDSVSILNTRIVAPLRKSADFTDKMISKIHIKLKINNEEYIVFISELAAVPSGMLGEPAANAVKHRTEITAAIDLLFTGF